MKLVRFLTVFWVAMTLAIFPVFGSDATAAGKEIKFTELINQNDPLVWNELFRGKIKGNSHYLTIAVYEVKNIQNDKTAKGINV